MSISCVILTKNEEANIASCLDSLHWCDDIHVVDSGSTDLTCDIAASKSVNVLANDFKSFANQRNWALDNCKLQHEWVLFLDADEHSTESFYELISNKTSQAEDSVAGYYCCWKLMLNETWLKYSDSFPKWQFRLLRRGYARFKDVGHGQKEEILKGKIEYIHEPYLHYSFSKGWDEWWQRHYRYAKEEAEYRASARVSILDLFSRHASIRKNSLKIIASKTPGWPIFKFFSEYIFKFGFLDGKDAFKYCKNKAIYEALIQREMRRF